VSQRVTAATFHPFYDEDDVRRLCGLTVFAQADVMQRAGHVSGAERTSDTLRGNVRGVWRRVDQVTILTKGNRLQPDCTRHGAGFCQHAGALLLHWLREPGKVAIVDPAPPVGHNSEFDEFDDILFGDPFDSSPSETVAASPEEELALLLERETISVIRDIARARGVKVAGSRKADVVRDAAAGLLDPANIDAALDRLSPPQRLLLDAAQLSSPAGETTEPRAFDIYRMLGGEGQPPLDGLRELGLVISPGESYYRARMILIPRSVIARLPPREGLAAPSKGEVPGTPERQSGLALVSLLTIIAQDALAGGISLNDDVVTPEYGYVPAGFVVHPPDRERMIQLMRTYNAGDRVRLVAQMPLAAADIERLARQTGQPSDVIEFAGLLMVSLGIAFQDEGLVVEPEGLRELLEADAVKQLMLLLYGWLGVAGWMESSLIFGDGGPVRFAWNPRHAAPHVSTAIADGVGLVVRLVGRMPAGTWHDAATFVETVEKLVKSGAPSLATFRQSSQILDLTWHGQPRPGQRLALRTPEGWSLFIRAIVDAVLGGPMTWLGLVDVQQQQGRVTAFHVRSTAAALSSKTLATEDLVVQGTLRVDDDLTIVVPAGSASIAAIATILHASELIRVADDGLHYQLTPSGIQTLFESGLNADAIGRMLSEQTSRPIPKAARATLDRWWAGYGRIRLYDELTLIELGDDLLLRELQAATSLQGVTLHQFTPRLIAVEDRAIEQLVTELGARGYAPRIVEGG
jgi:hypothetical protein